MWFEMLVKFELIVCLVLVCIFFNIFFMYVLFCMMLMSVISVLWFWIIWLIVEFWRIEVIVWSVVFFCLFCLDVVWLWSEMKFLFLVVICLEKLMNVVILLMFCLWVCVSDFGKLILRWVKFFLVFVELILRIRFFRLFLVVFVLFVVIIDVCVYDMSCLKLFILCMLSLLFDVVMSFGS